jgi:sugar lactone lactonase YvrE
MRSLRPASIASLAIVLASCSGGGNAPLAPGPTQVDGTLRLTIPTATAATSASDRRRPQYLSPSAESVSIAVTGVAAPVVANVAANSPACAAVPGGRSCNVNVEAPTGSVTFTVTLYDGANATGNVLGRGTATETIAAGTPFAVALGVEGVAGALAVTAGQATFTAGTAATTPVTVALKDADGNTITGTYASPVTLTNSDTTGAFTLSATSVTASTQAVTLRYNGSAAVTTATISASASGVPASGITPQTVSVTTTTGLHLYVANIGNSTATVTALTANGNVPPIINIGGANTQISQIYGIAVDAAKNIYASDLRNPVLTVYGPGATGNVAPIRTITGANTGLSAPLGLAVDAAGELICSNFGAETVTVYAAGANGDATPVRTISGSNTALGNPYGIALDAAGKLYVVDNLSQFGGTDELTVYAAGANGNVAPLQNITGSNTGMNGAVYDAVDAAGKIYVTSVTADAVTVYAAGATGNVAPIATISGANTGLVAPTGIAVDAAGNIYVGDENTNIVSVFAPGANGNVAPIRTIAGAATGLSAPLQMVVGP